MTPVRPRGLLAHLRASVFIGSMLSHFTQTDLVLPVLSVIAIKNFLHLEQRSGFIVSSALECV